ncbi:MAG: glutamyl-tRNA reductase [Candidatus Omnitrophica bacterium]|nr:glutamyl-tRNA reductase [Candidatus Omnitrophota bacterium]
MTIVVLGINHKKAPLEVRERFSFRDSELESHYQSLVNTPEIKEAFILSTCNRVEIYGVGENAFEVIKRLTEFLSGLQDMPADFLENYFYQKTDTAALEHLFRVASGLDSMVIGEQQIMGQIKKAYEQASAFGVVGPYLHRTIQDALRVGKKARNLTGISRGVTSISGVVVELVKNELNIQDKKVLVIGAGKVGAMTVSKLSELAIREIALTNRDIAKAEELIKKENVKIVEFVNLPTEMLTADIVIAATSAPHLIGEEMVKGFLKGRQKGILFIDLGVPRNVEETVRGIDGVRLYNIDDLAPVIDRTMLNREIEAVKAEKIIQRELALVVQKAAHETAAVPLCEPSFSV